MTTAQPLLLALEASAGQASAAIAYGDRVLARAEKEAAHGHAAWMVTLAEEVLAKAGQSPTDLDAVIGGTGPGSFTGIRVALAAAKGFGLTQGLSPIGISSLAGLAAGLPRQDKPILSLIDSRRKSYFFQVFDADLTPLSAIVDGSIEDITALILSDQNLMQDGLMITGHDRHNIAATLMAQDAFPPLASDLILAQTDGGDQPSAEGLIRAYRTAPELAASPEPLYLAPPILGPSTPAGDR